MPEFHVTADRPLHFEYVLNAATEEDAKTLARKLVDLQLDFAVTADQFSIEAIDIASMRKDTGELFDCLD
jgi:hypothetical protein